MYDSNTIQDLEDLPTLGYDKLPLQSKFFLNAGYQITAMSGKFHTEWGEFGGFKHPDALKYEASAMIAFGANCNFGDQLHPNGEIDQSTYENIGYAFNYVKKIEAFGVEGKPISKLGVWRSFTQACDEGLSKMLLESQIDFDVANFSSDFSEYEGLIFPSETKLSKIEINKVKNFIVNGGAVISLSKSILNFIQNSISEEFGLENLGKSNFDCDYTLVHDLLYPIFVKTPFLNYIPALRTKPLREDEVLADIFNPYFNRTIDHYCSHQNTPFEDSKSGHPAVIKSKNCIFIAHALDKMYHKYGARIHRELLNNCINLLNINPIINVSLPSCARISLLHQEKHNRYALHLLYASPVLRGITNVIEDQVPLFNVEVDFEFPSPIQTVKLMPDNLELEISRTEMKSKVVIPKFTTHCVLLFQYL